MEFGEYNYQTHKYELEIIPYNPIIIKIQCLPFYGCTDFCIQCDRVTIFDSNLHCYGCGCDSPVGESNDYSISSDEFENYYKKNKTLIK